jgi:predicted ABC-type transport system involved in lysophospholipase L1 biosynthesis ATPase subunit
LENPLEHICDKDRVSIADYLFSDKQSWTVVAVTSDPYMAMKADKTLVMKEGRASSYDKLKDVTQLLNA